MIKFLTSVLGVAGIAAAGIAAAVGLPLVGGPTPARAAADFRVIDVRAEYGQMVVEAQHFNPDGSHWFYENYTFQGREQYKRPRLVVLNEQKPKGLQNQLYLNDGTLAPTRLTGDGTLGYYLPKGAKWLRASRPHLDKVSILSVVQSRHQQRQETGWDKGKSRLTTHPMNYTAEDQMGAAYLTQRFGKLKETAYLADGSGTLRAYTAPLPPIDPYVSTAWGTVSTFYPDADAESTSVDGHAVEETDAAWATIRAAAGDVANDTDGTMDVNVKASGSSNVWTEFARAALLFDTSSLPDTDSIDSVDLDLVATSRTDDFTDSISVVTSAPASDTAVVGGDFDSFGTTKQAPDTLLSSYTVDSSTFNTHTLNATGESNISLTGITKFGLRPTSDNDDSEPTWASTKRTQILFASADEVLGGDKRPRLVVTHTAPSAAITGTIGDGATEQEVRDGSGAIIITLTGDTWVAAGGTFDAQRQNIIDGLDAAESETNGWNAQVRDQIGVSSVARTSDTIVTVTITDTEVDSYRVDSNETITVTVPASALVTSTSAITATPTIAITAGAESAALTGTLSDNGTPAEIVAGSQTIIYTLTNTVWVASGATFNAQRQGIIDHLVSNLSDQNGWNNRRSDFAVGDVVRTSDTIVTITLSASSAYAIPATETITATVPNEALVYAVDLSSSTFNIVPSFQSSGNRVTAAIDLSSVTDVAYCSLAWEATTPTNTTVTVDTSVDGGSNYTTGHVNGNCPSGISVDASLATITDFRIRVNLSTTDSTVTPTVETLALIIEDDSGQELYYQLNTAPSATLTDRSSSGAHTGTMSFPTRLTGVSHTLGDLNTTSSAVTREQALAPAQITSEVSGAAIDDNLFSTTETGWTGLPFQGVVEAVSASTAGDLPQRAVWALFIGVGVVILGMLILHFTTSLFAAAVAMGVGLGLAGAMGSGLVPMWSAIMFIPIAGSLLLFKKGLPV